MDDVQNIVREKTEPVASMLEQSHAILNKLAVGDDGRIQVGVQAMEQGEGFIQHVDRNVCPGKLFIPHRLFSFSFFYTRFSHGTIV